MAAEAQSVSQTLKVEGVPGGNAGNGWWRILEQHRQLDGSPTDEDHGPVLHLGNIEHACMLPLLPAHSGPDDSQQFFL